MAPIAEYEHVFGCKHEGAVYPRLTHRHDVVHVLRRVAADLAAASTFDPHAPDHLLVAFQVGDGH